MLTFVKFLRDDSGATAIEYGLIAAGIAVAIIAVVQGVGTKLTVDVQVRFGQPQVKLAASLLEVGLSR